MREMLSALTRFDSDGTTTGRAVVVHVWGSAPRQTGSTMLVTADGRFDGSVSGGCIETAVVGAVQNALAGQRPHLERYGVPNAKAWDLGLACGGSISVWIEPGIRPEIRTAAVGGGACCATIVEGTSHVGASLMVYDDGRASLALPPMGDGDPAPAVTLLASLRTAIEAEARHALTTSDASRVIDLPSADATPVTVLLELLPRPSTLLIIGAVATAVALAPMAKQCGFRTIVIDGRSAFLSRERFPDADELVCAWPAEGFAQVGLDRGSYVCILSHDPKFDEPALEIALRSEARYVGAIGSKKTQAARRAALVDKGFSEAEIGRLYGPIGLDLGGRDPAETALAVLAEIVGVRYGSRLVDRKRTGS